MTQVYETPMGVISPDSIWKTHPHASVVELSGHEGSRYLVQSPYSEKEHLLDIRSLDNENALLARALADLRCLRDDYATAPYIDSFNWNDVMERLRALVAQTGTGFRESFFYIVAFRSQIPPTTVYSELGELDKAAHAEANASGGFLKCHAPAPTTSLITLLTCHRYWFGNPDAEGRNLATCVWRSRADAVRAGHGKAHRRASRATASMYSFWKIDRHKLVIADGVETWEIVDWSD
jgi:hypothetical protein